jgi:cyclopropane-fatty-acyl-phospholipid synthase
LRLTPGESVVEAGCGWGGFAIHAARRYGVRIRSFNVSREQVAHAREWARRLELGDRVEFVLDDYRNIGSDGRRYDKFVSIGMLEHVGAEHYPGFYRLIDGVTRPGGLALVHSISRTAPVPLATWRSTWLAQYIFPGSHIPSLVEMLAPLEQADTRLHVVDVENLRHHYALTLDRWHERYEAHADAIRTRGGEPFLRMFRLYLCSAAAAFRHGGLLLFQVLLTKGTDDSAPLTRNHFFPPAD